MSVAEVESVDAPGPSVGAPEAPAPGTHWDLVCVGAGIANLAFAAQVVALHPGLRVLVVDKHLVPGGYASAFRRPLQSAEFDCSLHKLSGMTGEGNLRRIFSALGLDRELEFVYPTEYFDASFPEGGVVVPNDPVRMKALLQERFPDEAEAVASFFQEVETHGRNAYFQFQMMDGTYEVELKQLIREVRYAHRNLRPLTVTAALVERFESPRLRDILSAPCGYVGGYPDDLGYLYFLHIVYATLHAGNAYVRGGSQRLSDALVRRIESAGGRVMLRTRVEHIRTHRVVGADGDAVCAVVTSGGEFRTSQVSINASPHHAMQALFDPIEALLPVRRKLEALKPSWSTTTLYLVVDRPPRDLGLRSTETFLFDMPTDASCEGRRRAAELAGELSANRIAALAAASCGNDADEREQSEAACESAYWASAPIELTDYHALSPQGGMIVIMNVLDRIGHWPERRTPAYKAKKKRAADTLLKRLVDRFPGFRGHVTYTELSSPRTYLRYTNNTDGAGYGALIADDLSGHAFHRNFPIRGVHFMSAWVAGPSYEAAFGFAEQKARSWRPDARPTPMAAVADRSRTVTHPDSEREVAS